MGEVVELLTPDSIDPQTDALIDRLEAGGLNFYVMDGGPYRPFLAFEHGRPPVTPDGVAAAAEFATRFAEDAALRKRVSGYAMSVGAFFRPL